MPRRGRVAEKVAKVAKPFGADNAETSITLNDNKYGAFERNVDDEGEVQMPGESSDDNDGGARHESPPQPSAERPKSKPVVGSRRIPRSSAPVVAADTSNAAAAIGHGAEATGAGPDVRDAIPRPRGAVASIDETIASPTTTMDDLARLATIAAGRKTSTAGDSAKGAASFLRASDSAGGFISFAGAASTTADGDDPARRAVSESSSSASNKADDDDHDMDAAELQRQHFLRTAEVPREDARAERHLDDALEVSMSDDDDDDDEDGDAADAAAAEEDNAPLNDDNNNAMDEGAAADAELAAALAKPVTAATQLPTKAARQSLHGITFEHRETVGFAPATVVCLTRPLSIAGPCVVWPLAGVASVAGAVTYPDCPRTPYVHVPDTATTVASADGDGSSRQANRRKKNANADDAVAILPLPAKKYLPNNKKAGALDDAARDAVIEHVETQVVGGPVDWAWVSRVVDEWKQRLGSLPTTVLLLGPVAEGVDAQAVTQSRRRMSRTAGLGATEIARTGPPAAFAPYEAPLVAAGLYAEAVPAMMKQRSPVIFAVGQQGVGKSTVARQLSNALLSKTGSCLYLDLDPGQGDVTPSGTMTLAKLTRPTVTSRIGGLAFAASPAGGGQVLRTAYLGSSVVQNPPAAAAAVDALCLAARAAMEAESNLPLVVNTHGWVHGIGRRVIVHAMQLLAPTHVVHLMLQEDDDWLGEMGATGAIADPKSGLGVASMARGLSAPLVSRLLLSSSAPSTPAVTAVKKLAFELHRVAVPRAFDKMADKMGRRMNRWRSYFGVPTSDNSVLPSTAFPPARVLSTSSGIEGTTGSAVATVVRVPLSRVTVVAADAPERLANGAQLLPDAVVALARIAAAPSSSSSSSRGFSELESIAEAPDVLGFAAVVRLEAADGTPVTLPSPVTTTTTTSNGADADQPPAVVVLASPIPADVLRAAGCNAIVVGRQPAPRGLADAALK